MERERAVLVVVLVDCKAMNEIATPFKRGQLCVPG